MNEAISGFLRYTASCKALARTLTDLRKALARTVPVHAERLALSETAIGQIARLEGIEKDISALKTALASQVRASENLVVSERALLAGQVAAALKSKGFSVEGNLPLLRVGAITLELEFGTKPQVLVWFGPRKERLASCDMDPSEVADAVTTLDAQLFRSPLDTDSLLAELFQAYRVALTRHALLPGSRVPLPALMVELTVGRQKTSFMADPKRENFRGCSRAEFAASLSRLTVRRQGNDELRFDVATMDQSRRQEDHLWVPRGQGGDGVLLATAHVARMT